MRLAITAAAAAAILLTVPAARLAAQSEVRSPADPWVHTGTGTPFPARIGSAERGRIIEFSDDGRDVSVGYTIESGARRAAVTLYVYPVMEGFDCQATFEDAKASIARYKGAQLVAQGAAQGPAGTGGLAALHARYAIPAGGMGENTPSVRSELYLFCPPGDTWLVKSRATWADGSDFSEAVEDLIQAIRWPASLGG